MGCRSQCDKNHFINLSVKLKCQLNHFSEECEIKLKKYFIDFFNYFQITFLPVYRFHRIGPHQKELIKFVKLRLLHLRTFIFNKKKLRDP